MRSDKNLASPCRIPPWENSWLHPCVTSLAVDMLIMQAIRDWIEFIFLMRFRYSPCAVADLLASVTAVLQFSIGCAFYR